MPSSVATVAVIDPATIEDDDWSTGEAAWRARMQAILELPPDSQRVAFRQAMMQPLLVITCGRSYPRFAEVSARLGEVVPDVTVATCPSLSHLESPQRHEPERLSALLVELWTRSD
jgi:hypothetical protein